MIGFTVVGGIPDELSTVVGGIPASTSCTSWVTSKPGWDQTMIPGQHAWDILVWAR